ncbi:hypothetical protein [Enterobacter hormaechei]|uniref:hypothetical protein n=1 Tax=Enterobacter hormaechei TaxID=158836 RepID=UPI0011DDED66|nr:hypothetical protein [Enterobacter hormaechei]TXT70865.1 hypothetical protein D4N14_23925 [Enterobacter hormaechei]
MTFTKERLTELSRRENVGAILGEEIAELARIALASLEAEPVAWLLSGGGAKNNVSFDSGNAYADPLREVTPLYTAPPAPVPVPAAMEMDDDFDSAFEHGKAVGWNACRAAMLQGADGTLTNEGTIPVTQFKPVADLYGLTSPTGGETSFTFDAVEARDFIDGGWSCQEYVELGRFQEAMLQNGNSPAQSDCCPEQNYIAPAQDGDSPVIPDGWVLVPIEPTEDMIVNGFESEPDESFSDEKEWEAYEAMSGCQQAAHRAKLCWEAMISAAPKPAVR